MTQSLVRLSIVYAVLLSVIIFFSLCFTTVAQAADSSDTISLDAKGAILIDQKTGKVLYEKNSNERLYPASTTKILTALVALERGNLDDTVTVGKEVLMVPWDSSKAFLREGEQITLRELLMGLLLPSGNDAAETIAVYIGRKVAGDMSLDETKAIGRFVELMNERAKQAGASSSNFVNPHGYDDKNHYTTPHDLALIAREAMKSEFFREVVGTSKYSTGAKPVVKDGQSSDSVDHVWTNSNALINKSSKYYYEYATGIKTGYTTIAGQCVVSSASKDGMDLIAVVMDSTTQNRWADSKKLLEYGFDNFGYYKGTDKGEAVYTLKVDNPSSKGLKNLTAVSDEAFSGIFKKEEAGEIEKSIAWEKSLISPLDEEDGRVKLLSSIKAGEVIGKEVFTLNGSVIKEIDLKAGEGVKKYSVMNSIEWFLAGAVCGAIGVMMLMKRAAHKRRRDSSRLREGYLAR